MLKHQGFPVYGIITTVVSLLAAISFPEAAAAHMHCPLAQYGQANSLPPATWRRSP